MRSKCDDKPPNCLEQREKKYAPHASGGKCEPRGQKLWNRSCLLWPASASYKRRKLIFAKFSAVKDDSHSLACRLKMMCEEKWKSDRTEEYKQSSCTLPMKTAVITHRFWFWFSSLNEKRDSVIVAASNCRPAGVFLRCLTYLLRGPFTPQQRCCHKCPHSLPLHDWI